MVATVKGFRKIKSPVRLFHVKFKYINSRVCVFVFNFEFCSGPHSRRLQESSPPGAHCWASPIFNVLQPASNHLPGYPLSRDIDAVTGIPLKRQLVIHYHIHGILITVSRSKRTSYRHRDFTVSTTSRRACILLCLRDQRHARPYHVSCIPVSDFLFILILLVIATLYSCFF